MSGPSASNPGTPGHTLRPPSPALSGESSTRTLTPAEHTFEETEGEKQHKSHLELDTETHPRDFADVDLEAARATSAHLAIPIGRHILEDAERSVGDLSEVFSPGEEAVGEIEREKADPFLVVWEEGDKGNPKNWGRGYRWYITIFGGLLTLNATFASSAPSGVIPSLIEDFGMSQELATLLIAIFVVGYCIGPLLWGPLSESFGRRPIFIIAFGIYTIFQIACAVAPNTGALIVFRFFGGAFASAPLTNAGALLADIWNPDTRGKSMAFFTLAPFAGPALGPIVSGYMSVAGVNWRWLFWVLSIFAGVCWFLILFTLPETYGPVLLTSKAKAIRLSTGDSRYYSALERADTNLRARVSAILARPFKVLFLEPMLIFITIYMSFVYGCIYLLFEAFPIVFTIGHGMNEGESGLMFLPLFLGGAVGVLCYLLYFNPRYEAFMRKYAPNPVPPEHRMEMAFLGGPLFAIAFFWFGWTSYPSISFWAPLMSILLIGFGVVLIFLSLFNYIIDAYLMVAASALASSTVVRSAFGAGFPLFATQMFDKLNPRWASTLLGCIALLLIPIPFVLSAYGRTLRQRSKYAPTRD
ncbi:MFS general substrate transporter [Dacryopinax primogenitus]|uniref:MFS general substrate transporter n=1 Tax=Dacryopinax primogenitus (strain DJM 731) TaxID=1858805 RepID=M5GGP7_DACPD|nr:MFS general substrate transporter [Dacryopinax primogenitus]EJU05858.1 MFS general substrate transporter [Dacryopinax primogenitus]